MKNLKEKLEFAEILKLENMTAIKVGSKLIISFENENEVETFLNEDPTELLNSLNISSISPCTKKEFAAHLEAMEPDTLIKTVIDNKYFKAIVEDENFKKAIIVKNAIIERIEDKIFENKTFQAIISSEIFKDLTSRRYYLSVVPNKYFLTTPPRVQFTGFN